MTGKVYQVTSGVMRPHFIGPNCWCSPLEDDSDCECGECGTLWIHRHVDMRPDNQLRMCAFSS